MARQARCNRVHSALTYQVHVIEAGKVNVHAAFLKFASGQLPFLGSYGKAIRTAAKKSILAKSGSSRSARRAMKT